MASSPDEHDLVARPPIDTSKFESLSPDRFDRIYLYREENTSTDYRFRLTVVDRKLTATTPLNCATAVFLIPAGRESEYMFSTQAGLLSVAESAGCGRLIAVAFGRRHEFSEDQSAIQEELTFVAQVLSRQGKFLPPAHYRRYQKLETMQSIPFMALDGVGKRNVLAEGETSMSGKYLVEQVRVNDKMMRRLYFMDNPFVIQSEVAMSSEDAVDKTFLAFDYHKTMAAGLLALSNTPITRGVVIGLGGGGLVNFLQTVLPSTHISVVELDPSVVTVAESYFGFQQNEQTVVRVGDGLSLSSEMNEDDNTNEMILFEPESLDFIALDVDSKDKRVGMSCPPQQFVEIPYLTRLKTLLSANGWLIINVSARDPSMLELVKENVQAVFGSVFCSDSSKVSDDVNVVLFASASFNMAMFPPAKRLDALHRSMRQFVITSNFLESPSLQATLSDLEDCATNIKVSGETSSPSKSKKKKSGGKRKKGKRK